MHRLNFSFVCITKPACTLCDSCWRFFSCLLHRCWYQFLSAWVRHLITTQSLIPSSSGIRRTAWRQNGAGRRSVGRTALGEGVLLAEPLSAQQFAITLVSVKYICCLFFGGACFTVSLCVRVRRVLRLLCREEKLLECRCGCFIVLAALCGDTNGTVNLVLSPLKPLLLTDNTGCHWTNISATFSVVFIHVVSQHTRRLVCLSL